MSRIYWTKEEQEQVMQQLVLVHQNNPAERLIRQLMKAQEVLPAERRRAQTSLTTSTGFKEWVSIELQRRLKAITEKPPEQKIEQKIIEVEKDLSTVSIDMLLGELVRRLVGQAIGVLQVQAEELKTKLQIKVASQGPTLIQKEEMKAIIDAQPNPLPKPKRPCVAVVGLFHDQFMHVRDKINGQVDLRYVNKELSEVRYPPQVDYIIVEKHTEHKWWDGALNFVQPTSRFWATGQTGVRNIVLEKILPRTKVSACQ